MSKKILRTIVLALLVVSLLAGPVLAVAEQTSGAGTVTASALNLRAEPSTSAESKALIYWGSPVVVLGQTGDWYKVNYKGTVGYVYSQYINFSQSLDADFGMNGVISGTDVRLRAEASTSSAILGHYNSGASFKVIGVSGEWIKVSTAAGVVGNIHSAYLDCAAASTGATAPSGSTGSQIVATARQYLGVPYVWGGMSPYGFDCSGLVNYVYKAHGYSLHRVAQDIYTYDGVHVDKSDLQPGDIVCFGYSAWSIGHVGIYIGDGRFIHSPSSGSYVSITSLDSGYYSNRLIGAKRIIG